MDKLRPYQSEGINRIFSEWREGKRSVLFQMPTGTGKTVIFAEIVRRGHEQQRKILIVAHRKELIEQIESKLKHSDVEAGIIMAGVKPDYSKIVQIASIQTLSRRDHPEANLIIIDECHHAKAASYKRLWTIYPDAKFLGVTATPIRLSGDGFNDLFDVLLPAMSVNKFIEQGYLSKVKHYVGTLPNLINVKKRHGDYVPEMLKNVMMEDDLMANLVESYLKHTKEKSTIVFAVNVEHSLSIAKRYNEAGIKAKHIDANTPKAERTKIIADFINKDIKVLSNVEIITEGFDFPACEVVQLARPTKSLSLYLQMVGRVMRVYEGKEHGIVLDNAGLWLEHGLSTIDRDWSLEGLGKKPKKDFSDLAFAAIDKEGNYRKVSRFIPSEIEGLELVELTEIIERMFIFEEIVQKVKIKEYKLITAYYRYKDYLTDNKIPFSTIEFEYVKNRLNKIDAGYPEDKKFDTGFWYWRKKELKAENPEFDKKR